MPRRFAQPLAPALSKPITKLERGARPVEGVGLTAAKGILGQVRPRHRLWPGDDAS